MKLFLNNKNTICIVPPLLRHGVALLACLLSLSATARQATDTIPVAFNQDSSTLLEVIISATRDRHARFTTPFSTEKVNSPENDKHLPRTTPEALTYTPGVFVQKTNHGGGSPFLRGLTGNQTLLMIDGIRYNNATFRFGPNQYPNLVDVFTLDRMEVVKGTGSVQYGSDAMGGVIHMLTKDKDFTPKGSFSGNFTGRAITQDMEFTARLEAGYSNKNLSVMGGYTWRQFGDLYGGDTTGKQSPSGYDENDWNLKLKARLNDRMTLIFSSQQVVQRNVPLYHRVALENFEYYIFDPQRMRVSYARLNWSTRNRLFEKISFTAINKYSEEGRQYHRNGNANYYAENDEVSTWGATADVFSAVSEEWTANSGVEWYNDQVQSTRIRTNGGNSFNERGLYPDGARQGNLSVYSLHHIRWKGLNIEPGLRYNALVNTIPAANSQAPGAPDAKEDISIKPSALVGNLAASYTLHQHHVVYASFSTGYRAPGLDDMGTLGLVDFRYEVPAYDLEPEKNFNTEIGYRYSSPRFQANVAAYYMHLKDLISRVRQGADSLQGYPVYIKVNDQQAYIRGFEANLQWRVFTHVSLQSFAAWQYGQNLTRNEPMRRIPPLNGLNAASWQKGKWYISLEHQWAATQDRLAQGDKDDNRIPKGGTPGWQVVNLHGGLLTPAANIRLSWQNIFNEDYRTHGSGINGMGRALVMTLQLGIGRRKG